MNTTQKEKQIKNLKRFWMQLVLDSGRTPQQPDWCKGIEYLCEYIGHRFKINAEAVLRVAEYGEKKITASLCTYEFPDLLENTAHSQPASRIAARYLRHHEAIGHLTIKQIIRQDRQRSRRVSKMSTTLICGEYAGRW